MTQDCFSASLTWKILQSVHWWYAVAGSALLILNALILFATLSSQ
jgi:hypothetical protein